LFLHCARAGSQIRGDAAGGAGEGQDAHDDQQHRADLHRVAHHILVGLEEIQHRAGEESHCQEGQYEAQGVHADQQKSR
ncbi:Anaerobic benzoate catabolism transcriptional regulator, partial [Dysosmobacter welbionis]